MPNYLCRNRHGTYYFRFIPPKDLRHYFKCQREYRHSLKTDSKKLAVHLSTLYRARIQLLLEQLTNMADIIKTELLTELDIFGREITVDYDGDEEKELRVMKQRKDDAINLARQLDLDPIELLSRPVAINNTPVLREQKKEIDTSVTISQLANEYLDLLRNRRKLTKKTLADYSADYDLFTYIAGKDMVVNNLTNHDMEVFYNNLKLIPTSHNSDHKYQNRSFIQLSKMRIPKNRIPDVTTRNKKFSRISTLLKYAVKKGYLDRNPADSIILEKDLVRSRDKREILSSDDLVTIFNSPFFIQHGWQKRKARRDAEPYRFWLFPLALFTGARQGELIQLDRKNIAQDEDGTWFIDIKEEYDKVTGQKIKSAKNSNSIRRVPLCDTLIDMGFLEFAKSGRSKQMFPELNSKKDGKDAAQKFLNAQLERWGVHKKTKTYHSFRHTFITKAINQDIDPRHIGGVTGHLSKEDYAGVAELANTYSKGFTPTFLKEKVLDKLNYNISFDKIKW